MEKIIDIQDLYFKPIGASDFILKGVNLEVHRGDFILLLGPSGCGKSMLTHCLVGLIPHLTEGEMKGSVTVNGLDTKTNQCHHFSSAIGLVFQNPDDQILSLKVVDEVAWGVENQGLAHEEIKRRVDEFMEMLEISYLKNRLTFAISGGQKQKVSIASNLAMLQDVLVLDDPTTDLDPVCKGEVVAVLKRLHEEYGKTIIVIEHDLNDLVELANRIVLMENGKVKFDGKPGEILANHYEELLSLGVNIPQHIEIANIPLKAAPVAGEYPVLKKEAFDIFQQHLKGYPAFPAKPAQEKAPDTAPVISVQKVNFSYDKGRPILKNINFNILQGEFVAIVGANGSGKSTLIGNLIGLLRPNSGDVIIDGQNTKKSRVEDLAKNIGFVFQNPDHQLFTNSIQEEVGFSLQHTTLTEEEKQEKISNTLKIVELDEYQARHPFSLSRGQRQKLAVATALIHQPRIILLDEPTTGQDRKTLSGLLDMLSRLNREGNTTVMVTHDMDIVAAYASRVIVMANGEIVMDGPPEDVFYDQYEKLKELSLKPPTVIDFCKRLEDQSFPRFLTVEAMENYLSQLAPVKL